MKILIVSGSPFMGGAEIAARRVALAIASCGSEVIFVSLTNTPLIHALINHIILEPKNVEEQLSVALKYISYPASFYYQTQYFIEKIKLIIKIENPDIINIHNIKQAFCSSDFVGWASKLCPTVWTLHDMSSFTGRCTYSFECEQFLYGCKKCPRIHIPIICSQNFIQSQWIKNQNNILNNKNLFAITPSHWLKSEAIKGFWHENQIRVIPNCIDIMEYYPHDNTLSKKELGIFDGNQTILFTSHSIYEKRKGITALLESLSTNYPEAKISILLMGHGNLPKGLKIRYPVYNLGYISKELMPTVYSAADLLIHPSIADNLPNVIMESLSVGTPVVGFNIGGIPEMIIHGKTGWIIHEMDYNLMSGRILEALNVIKANRSKIQTACRSFVKDNYSEKNIGNQYISFFSTLIK